MKRKIFAPLALCMSSMCLTLPVQVLAQNVLNVRDADIRAFVEDAAKVTGRTFIVDGRVQGKVSVVTDRPLSKSEYFEVFLATLRANGLVAIPVAGGALRIQPATTAATQPGPVGSARANRNQFVTEVFRLKSIDAASAVETLRPLVSQEGSVTANRSGNSLVVADYADNIRRIRALIAQIDQDNASTQLVVLDNASAREIAQALQQLTPGGGEGGTSPVSIAAIDSSNAIAMRGDPRTLGKLAAMARELDARAANGSEIRVVYLDYADSATLVPVLERLVGARGSAQVTPTPSAPPAGPVESGSDGAPLPTTSAASIGGNAIDLPNGRGQAIITRYEGANAVIISAPVTIQKQLTELVRQLDKRQDQVLVEAIIVEISDSVAKELGVQLLLGGTNIPFAVTNFSNVTPNIVTIAGGLLADSLDQSTTVINGNVVTTTNNSQTGDFLRQNAAQQILGARGGFTGFKTDLGNNTALGAIINAVQADTNSNILSTPHLTVNNNVEGSILFGQEIPVSTGEALSSNFDNAFRTIQRQNVGIELVVTPQINADNEVKLDLRQEVSSIAGPVSNNFSELIINKREIKTTITVGDGQIVSLGGLLDDNERRTIEKIPLLGDIPIIGELFKSRGRSRVKTNLMVFIRPTILRNQADARAATARRYGYIRNQQLLRNPDQEPALDELVRDYLGTTPPAPLSQDDVYIRPYTSLPPTVLERTEIPQSTSPDNTPPEDNYNVEGNK